MVDSPIISPEIKKQVDLMTEEYLNLYKDAIQEKLLRNLPIPLIMQNFYQGILTTVSYLKNSKINNDKERKDLIENSFNAFLYGMRL